MGFNLRFQFWFHGKDIYKAGAIPASRNFAVKDHFFNRDTSFIIIERIRKSTLKREKRCIKKGKYLNV